MRDLITLAATSLAAVSAVMVMPPPHVAENEAQTGLSEPQYKAAHHSHANFQDSPVTEGVSAGTNPCSLNIDKVPQQAGYLSTPSGNQLFYWFFESRNNSAKDPVLIWLNGGPGCSSLEAVLFENGPASIDSNNEIHNNPYSWNSFSNLLFIDNPAGVGYSLAENNVLDSVTAAEDFKEAMKQFYIRNPQFKSNKLHISGESYAGRYIPVFTEAINADPSSPVKVSSAMIGNGLVSPMAEYAAYHPMLCGQGGFDSVLSDGECQQLEQQTPQCLSAMQNCVSSGDRFTCRMARIECNPLEASFRGRNPYDIRDATCQQSATNLCYPVMDNVQNYFNRASVKSAVGAEQVQSYSICSNPILQGFYGDNDPYQPTYQNVTNLLNQGTPILIYHGDADIVLNWLGGRQWTHDLTWAGQPGFQSAINTPVEWKPANGQKRGEVSNFDHFTFLRVNGAGHMVPHDQPESAYYMAKSWLNGDFSFSHG